MLETCVSGADVSAPIVGDEVGVPPASDVDTVRLGYVTLRYSVGDDPLDSNVDGLRAVVR